MKNKIKFLVLILALGLVVGCSSSETSEFSCSGLFDFGTISKNQINIAAIAGIYDDCNHLIEETDSIMFYRIENKLIPLKYNAWNQIEDISRLESFKIIANEIEFEVKFLDRETLQKGKPYLLFFKSPFDELHENNLYLSFMPQEILDCNDVILKENGSFNITEAASTCFE